MSRTAVVIGGGIAGLTAAYRLSSAPGNLHVTLLEASPRLGGKIKTTPFGGVPVDEGADAFLTRVPWAIDLCRELGLDDRFISPASGHAYLVSRGRLRHIPEKTVMGVPTSLRALAKSGVVSPFGMLRAGLDLVKPDNWPGEDESVAELVSRRLGPEIAERLVDPLVSGIMASDTHHLSSQIVTPQLAEATRKNRSLIRALQAQRAAAAAGPGAGTPVFYSFEGGIGVLTDRLRRAIPDVDIHLSTPASAIEKLESGYRVVAGGRHFDADVVVVAAPARHAGPLVRPHAPTAATMLSGVEYASVALVTVAFGSDSVNNPTDGSGFLVPRQENMLMTACSWGHRKWPHWAPDGARNVFRISTGRFGDERALHLDDDHLVESLLAELAPLLDIHGRVLEWRVSRWPDSFPQYPPGHGSAVTRAEADMAKSLPGVSLAGASYRGVGIPACIRSGNEAAAQAIDHLSARPA